MTALTVGQSIQTPPFKGRAYATVDTYTSGCHSYKVGQKPDFDLKTGTFNYSAAGSARICNNPAGPVSTPSWSMHGPGFVATIPITKDIPPAFGPTSVALNWSAVWSHSGSVSVSGHCLTTVTRTSTYNQTYGNCEAVSEAYLFATAAVYDLTNGSVFYPTGGGQYGYGVSVWDETLNNSQVDWTCYVHGNCTSSNLSYAFGVNTYADSGKVTDTQFINGTFVKGHDYVLLVNIDAIVCDGALGWSKASAKTSLNGDSARLVNFSVV